MKTLTIFFTALVLIAPVSQAQTFAFTAIPDADEARLAQRFNKIADYLGSKLGIPVKYLPVKFYLAAVTSFRHNQIQLA